MAFVFLHFSVDGMNFSAILKDESRKQNCYISWCFFLWVKWVLIFAEPLYHTCNTCILDAMPPTGIANTHYTPSQCRTLKSTGVPFMICGWHLRASPFMLKWNTKPLTLRLVGMVLLFRHTYYLLTYVLVYTHNISLSFCCGRRTKRAKQCKKWGKRD